jgi:hypothetical protein
MGDLLLAKLKNKVSSAVKNFFILLAYEERQTWEDYLGPEGQIVYLEWDRLAATAKGLENEWRTLYTGALQNSLIVPRPTEIFRQPKELFKGTFQGIRFNQLRREKEAGNHQLQHPL